MQLKTSDRELSGRENKVCPAYVLQMGSAKRVAPEQENCALAGGLFASTNRSSHALPLQQTQVYAKITGHVSRVEVTQTFANPFAYPIEAIYIFPLPDEAAVDSMEILIGDRRIEGKIQIREQAQQLYEVAKQKKRIAGLLEQERDNIFSQSLANIQPGESIKITIRYAESLKFSGGRFSGGKFSGGKFSGGKFSGDSGGDRSGSYEFVLPMVVGPRYSPGRLIEGRGDTDLVPDASRIVPPILASKNPIGQAGKIDLTIEIDAGLPIAEIYSPSHRLCVSQSEQIFLVQLHPEDRIANKDLILRYRVAGAETQATVLTQADERGGHFAVYLIPAIAYQPEEILPKDVVFLIDTSGSQYGAPLEQSKELMRQLIRGLNPQDTLAILDFANLAKRLSRSPLRNTPANRDRALQYINNLEANGGTELLRGIEAALDFSPAPAGRLRSIVLLTDGYIGNDYEAIARVEKGLAPGNRLYCFGVGSAVNRFLLNRLAEVGRGTMQAVRPDEDPRPAVAKFLRQINNPVLTNIQISWQDAAGKTEKDNFTFVNSNPKRHQQKGECHSPLPQIAKVKCSPSEIYPEIYPATIPDLFAEEPLVLFGRTKDCNSGKLRISGIAAGGQRYEEILEVNFSAAKSRPDDAGADEDLEIGNIASAQYRPSAIAQLWGRHRIKALTSQMFGCETTSGVDAVTATALSYQLLSPYTAFVAFSSEAGSKAGNLVSVQVPVQLPEWVSLGGIFAAADMKSARGLAMRSGRLRQPIINRSINNDRSGFEGGSDRSKCKNACSSADAGSPQPPLKRGALTLLTIAPLFKGGWGDPTLQGNGEGIVRTEAVFAQLTAQLRRHLDSVCIPGGLSGKVVFELPVRRGRVVRVVLDDRASTLKNNAALVLTAIKQNLQAWPVSPGLSGTLRVTLQIVS